MTQLSSTDARLLRVLLAVSTVAEGKTHERVDVDDVAVHLQGDIDLDLDRHSLEDLLQILWDRHLVNGFRGGDGLNTVFLEPSGKELAARFASARADVSVRVRQLQDDYLRWLYTQTEVKRLNPTVSDYLATSPSFHGKPYTGEELLTAGLRLKENGLIEGEGRYTYPAPAQPRLTANGRQVIEKGRSVHDEPIQLPAQYFNTTVHGNANVANASPGTTQALHVDAEWATKALVFLDSIEQALPTLPIDMSTTVSALVTDARNALADESPSRARRALSAIGSFLGDASSGALGGLLSAQALALIASLGS